MSHETWHERIPKVELHLHLEGAIPLDTLWTLIGKHGGDAMAPSKDALRELFRYRDFAHFIELWSWKNQFLREYLDFTVVGEGVARELARQNILYAEVFFSPGEFIEYGLQLAPLTEAIRAGLARVPEVKVALIVDVVRNFGPQRAIKTVEEAGELRSLGVIGIGLGGSEHEYPPELFREAFSRARALGLHTTAHAGEAAGAASVWGALNVLQVERLGHGIRSAEDPALVEHLQKKQVPLEICPISNMRTGVVLVAENHPARAYFDQGLLVTIGSDDPTLFETTLSGEYRFLERSLGFSPRELREIAVNGARAAWLSASEREGLVTRIETDPIWDEKPEAGR